MRLRAGVTPRWRTCNFLIHRDHLALAYLRQTGELTITAGDDRARTLSGVLVDLRPVGRYFEARVLLSCDS
ncbi:hypothetical protein [Jatrophihabitans fulvus]